MKHSFFSYKLFAVGMTCLKYCFSTFPLDFQREASPLSSYHVQYKFAKNMDNCLPIAETSLAELLPPLQ